MVREALRLGACQGFVSRFRVACSWLVSDDATLCREPQGTVVFDDAHNVVTGHFKTDTVEGIPFGVVTAESADGTYPEPSTLIHQRTVHLIVGQGVFVFIVMQVTLQLLVLHAIAPQTVALGGYP